MSKITADPLGISAIRADIIRQLGYPASHAPTLLSCTETAQVLGVQPNTLAVWRSTGRYSLLYVRVGRSVRYRVTDVAEFLHSRTSLHTGSARV